MGEAAGLIIKAAEKGQVQAANFNRLLALQMQIRLFSSDEIIQSAKKLLMRLCIASLKRRMILLNQRKGWKRLATYADANLMIVVGACRSESETVSVQGRKHSIALIKIHHDEHD
jgi:hypothetical protein